jgi:uncharacterized protein (DUF433 family)
VRIAQVISPRYLHPTSLPARAIIVNRQGDDAVEGLLARINITPGLRSGQPCIRNLRITVWDILKWLGTGASHAQIISDYPELSEEDILAALQWASNQKGNTVIC